MKWFNRLCYLVATEICMVRGKRGHDLAKPRQLGVGRSPPGREPEGRLEPVHRQAQARLGTPPEHQVHLACLQVTFALWAEPGTDPLASDRGRQRLLAEDMRGDLCFPTLCLSALGGLVCSCILFGSLGI